MSRLFLVFSLPLFCLSSMLEAQDHFSPCADLAKQYTELDSFAVEQLSYEIKYKLKNVRTCMLSFPWPPGEFFEDDDFGRKGVSLERMGEIRNILSSLLRSYKEDKGDFEALFLASRFGAPWALNVLMDLDGGRDPNILDLYADYLFIRQLFKQEKFEEVVSTAEEVLVASGVSIVREQPDEIEEISYFKKQRLINIIFLYKYKAISILGTQSLEDGYKHLRDFLASRSELPWEIHIFGDPTYDLFENINCEESLYEMM